MSRVIRAMQNRAFDLQMINGIGFKRHFKVEATFHYAYLTIYLMCIRKMHAKDMTLVDMLIGNHQKLEYEVSSEML